MLQQKEKEPKINKLYQCGKYVGRNQTYEEVLDQDGNPRFLVYTPDELKVALYQKNGDFRHLYNGYTYFESIDNEGTQTKIFPRPKDQIMWKLARFNFDFTKTQSKLDKTQIYEELRQFVKDHLDLPDERLYDVFSTWIMATWIPEMFQAVPYLNLLAPINTGKTRALEVAEATTYRGFIVNSISEATIFRAIDRDSPTLLIDEAQIYDSEDKKAVIAILNGGYRRGGKALRQVPSPDGDYETKAFNIFGFKAIAGIMEPSDSIVSRCIQISLFKAKRKINRFVDYKKANSIREQLLYWRLETLNEFEGLEGLDGILEGDIPSEWESANGRFLEKYMVLHEVSRDLPEARKNILSYGTDSFSDEINVEMNSLEAQVFTIILDLENVVVNGVFSVSKITELFNGDKPKNDQLKESDVGRVVRRLGFKPHRTKTGHAGVIWNEKTVEMLKTRYKLNELEAYSNKEEKSVFDTIHS